MEQPVIHLPWGNESLSMILPANWHVRGVLEPAHAALRLAQSRFPSGAEVLVFPYGGITYPEMR